MASYQLEQRNKTLWNIAMNWIIRIPARYSNYATIFVFYLFLRARRLAKSLWSVECVAFVTDRELNLCKTCVPWPLLFRTTWRNHNVWRLTLLLRSFFFIRFWNFLVWTCGVFSRFLGVLISQVCFLSGYLRIPCVAVRLFFFRRE